MEKERLSRREFLKSGALAAYYVGLGALVSAPFYPFAGLLSVERPGTIKPEDFRELVEVSDGITLSEQGPEGEVLCRVNLNKVAFCQALYDTANFMLPGDGVEKLYSVLKKKHLKVSLSPEQGEAEIYEGRLEFTAGDYRPYVKFGPEITFYGEYLRYYHRAQTEPNAQWQLKLDESVFHEASHLVQDLRNPIDFMAASLRYRLEQLGGVLSIIDNPDWWQTGFETEAERLDGQIAESSLEGGIPSGLFFRFS